MATAKPKRKGPAKPQMSLRGRRRPLAITMPPELIEQVDAMARAEDRSRTKMMELLIRRALAQAAAA